MRERLITDLTITVVPVLIGEGRRLFGELPQDFDARLVSSHAYPFGFTQAVYRLD